MRWLIAVTLCALVPALAQAQEVTRSAVILGLLVLAGLVLPNARRRRQARGGGTSGRR